MEGMERMVAIWYDPEQGRLCWLRANLGQHPHYALLVLEEVAMMLYAFAGVDRETLEALSNAAALCAAASTYVGRVTAAEDEETTG